MAVAQVGAVTTDPGSGLSSASRTVAYTLSASANCLTVAISFEGAPTPTISGVTWDSVAMTAAGTKAEDGNGQATQEWVLASATMTTGTHNVIVTGSANWEDIAITIRGWSGVDTATPTAGFASAITGTTSPATVNTAASAAIGDMVLDTLAIDDGVAGLTVDGTQIQDGQIDGAGAAVRCATSHKAGAGAVATMQWTFTGTQSKAIATVILKAGVGGGGPTDLSVSLGEAQIGGAIF